MDQDARAVESATLGKPEAQDIIDALRKGEVPQRGTEHFLVNREALAKATLEDLSHVRNSERGYVIRYLRGPYGAGKSLGFKTIASSALAQGFVVSTVVLDNRATRLDWIEVVYHSLMTHIETRSNRGAMAVTEILTQWYNRVLKGRLDSMVGRESSLTPAASYLGPILANYFRQPANRSRIISWLMGDQNIPWTVKREFDVKGEIDAVVCMSYLSAFTRLITEAGYPGLVMMLDEVESVLDLPRRDSRQRALENVRKLDENGDYDLRHTYCVLAATADFFENADRGVPTYQALHSRIRNYETLGRSFRNPIFEVLPLTREDVAEMVLKIRAVYEVAYDVDLRDVLTEEDVQKVVELQTTSPTPLPARELVRHVVHFIDGRVAPL
jgi:BREX system ATP-binding protein BrxC/D